VRLADITVVVPTRNEAHNIGHFLKALPEDLELIVVDASDDDTPHLVHALRPAHTRVEKQRSHVAMARQRGGELAQTPWLLFTDADISFSKLFFDHLKELPDYRATVGAVVGTKLADDTACPTFAAYYRWFLRGQSFFQALGIPAATGSSLLINRRALQQVGGFDGRLTCNEDSELVWRIKRAGYRVNFAPELCVMAHDHRRLHRGVLKKTLHSAVRCALLYLNLMPLRWRGRDWGYWKPRPTQHDNGT
jgi:cellulose synthase/poly-beta-1,6-N-acetylglucosamine synthase-like glycosyltransferase